MGRKVYSWGECDQLLRRAGFTVRQAKGSHTLYRHRSSGAITGLKMNHPSQSAGKAVSHLVDCLVAQVEKRKEH